MLRALTRVCPAGACALEVSDVPLQTQLHKLQTGIGLTVITMVPGIVLHIFNPNTQEAETGERQIHVNL